MCSISERNQAITAQNTLYPNGIHKLEGDAQELSIAPQQSNAREMMAAQLLDE